MSKNHSLIGKNVSRLDAVAKATGEAAFTVDVQLPRMIHAKFLRSPYSHARVKKIDTTQAEMLSGVAGVVTHKDLIGKIVHHDVLDDKVRFLGEAVAGVAALTEEIAEEALALIKIEYEVLPWVSCLEEAMQPESPELWPGGNICSWGGPRSIEQGCSAQWEKGDVEKGFQEADVVVDNTLDTQAQYHCCLEPHACVASWRQGMRELTLWVSTQAIYDDQHNLAEMFNLPLEKVRILCPFIGGGFGSKVHNTCKEYGMTAFLSIKTRRPVRYEPLRSEEVISALRHPASFYYKIGAKKDGTVTAVYLKAFRSGGAHTSLQMNFLAGSTEYVAPTYLMSPNVKYEGWSTYTNLPLCAAFRGFGYFESGAAYAQTMDILAESLHMDPLEFLLKNAPDRNYPVGSDQGPLTTGGIKETLQKCAEKIQWKEKWHQPGQKKLPDGRMHGIAVAYAMGRATVPPFVATGNAIIKLETDGKAHLIAGITDIGQGQATGLAQIAAETVGLNFEDVTVTWGDSIAPLTNFQAASSTTMMSGNATKLAAEDARKQILNLAAPVLKAEPEELDIMGGVVYLKKSPEKKVPLGQIVNLPGVKSIIGHGQWSIPDSVAATRTLVVCIAEVAVDTETGKIETIKMVQGTDCGRIISRERVEGQLQGVLSGGVGFAFTEDWVMDKGLGGRILNANLIDYKVPTFMDTMNILEPGIIVENPDPVGPYGARGMGEAVLSASAPALLNAVYNAIGIRFNSTPLTPDKVLKALCK